MSLHHYRVFCILTLFFVVSCDTSTEESVAPTVQTQNPLTENNFLTLLHDTTATALRLSMNEIVSLEFCSQWVLHGTSGGFLASDSAGVYVTAVGESFFSGIAHYTWNGQYMWTIPDSLAVGSTLKWQNIGSSTALALYATVDYIIAGYWGHIVGFARDGLVLWQLLLSNSYIVGNSGMPRDLSMLKDMYVLSWIFNHPQYPFSVVTTLDSNMQCQWELCLSESNEGFLLSLCDRFHSSSVWTYDSLPFRSRFCIAATDSTLFVAPSWVDHIYEFDNSGIFLRHLTNNQYKQNSRVIRNLQGAPILSRDIIGHIEYLGNDILAILYGPACFPTDSSEIWAINLRTGVYGVLPFRNSVATFSATLDNIVVSGCSYRNDTLLGITDLVCPYVVVSSWDVSRLVSSDSDL